MRGGQNKHEITNMLESGTFERDSVMTSITKKFALSDSTKNTLCHQFFEHYSRYLDKFDDIQLEFYPKNPDSSNPAPFIAVAGEGSTLQIVWFQKARLQMFIESFEFFQQSSTKLEQFSALDLFIMTLGKLVTTPNDQTNLKRHEKYMLEVHARCPDILDVSHKMLGLLLSSTDRRLNKSSILWYYDRKLLVLKNKDVVSPYFEQHMEHVCLKSAKNHFANYYCWDTVRWIFDNESNDNNKRAIFVQVFQFCRSNFTDCSAWDTLAYFSKQTSLESYSTYNRTSYKRIQRLLKLPVDAQGISDQKLYWKNQVLAINTAQEVMQMIRKLERATTSIFNYLFAIATLIPRITFEAELSMFRNSLEAGILLDKSNGKSCENLVTLQQTEYFEQLKKFLGKLDQTQLPTN